MIALALWIALLFALLTTLTAIVKAALEVDRADQAESLGFLRLTLTGIFGVVFGQAFGAIDWAWYWGALVSVLGMLALLLGSQLAAKYFGHQKFGQFLLKITDGLVNVLHLRFTPVLLPKLDIPEEFEQELHESVEDFGETIVREIMVPRIDMATVAADFPLTKAMSVCLRSGYSRLPVVGKNIDDIQGILYLKDISRTLYESPAKMDSLTVKDIARTVLFTPESKSVDDLLKEMQLKSTHIALVVDEYGGVAGLVTMEDVIEEIVGEISDEYDKDAPDVVQLADGRFRINARFALGELGELLELELEDEDVDSIGGLLTKELGRLPAKDDSVTVSGLTITADRIEHRRKRLTSVIVERNQDLQDMQAALDSGDRND